jgi:hypothetical protein
VGKVCAKLSPQLSPGGTEFAIIVKHKDIGQMNAPKRRIGTTEEEITTTTTFLGEEEVMAMATIKRTINLKKIATIAAKRGIPKQHAGCSLVMPTRDQRGSSQATMEMKQELQQKIPETQSNIF